MRHSVAVFCLAAAVAASAQSAPNTSTAPRASTAGKTGPKASATGAKATTSVGAFPAVYKVPADEKRLLIPQKTPFVLKYQDIKVGTGADGEAGKLWHVKYKGWRADDGVVFDNWEDHKRPVTDKDGKVEMGPDGKPKMGDPEPLIFPQGMGRLIPGFDLGVAGMKVGGKRRLFIPWQMAYGTRSIPDRPDHPGIPAKSNLIFDVELIDVSDMMPPQRPMMPPGGGNVHPQPSTPPAGSAPAGQPPVPDASKPNTPPPAAQPSQPSQPPQPAEPSKPAQPSTPPQTK